jgi:hypothetical protein
MAKLNYNQGSFYTGIDPEDDPQASDDEVREFKKQYDAMKREERDRFPTWLREQLEQM